jgi:hypothetical protein
MKFRAVPALLAVILAVATATARADDAPPASTPPAAPTAAKREHTPLEKQMSRMRRALRALHSQISDPTQNAASLDLVATMHDAAVTSLDLTPAKASDLTGAAKDQFLAHYQSSMKDFIAILDRLSAALKANDNVAAAKIYKELPDAEKKDHKEFRRPQKDASAKPPAPAPATVPVQP